MARRVATRCQLPTAARSRHEGVGGSMMCIWTASPLSTSIVAHAQPPCMPSATFSGTRAQRCQVTITGLLADARTCQARSSGPRTSSARHMPRLTSRRLAPLSRQPRCRPPVTATYRPWRPSRYCMKYLPVPGYGNYCILYTDRGIAPASAPVLHRLASAHVDASPSVPRD